MTSTTRGSGVLDSNRVTAVVLALDEALYLPDCLASLTWADELIVLDSGSTDGTLDIAHAAGARVVHHAFENYARQRQFALSLVATPWVLFVDADERVPAELAAELRAVVASLVRSAQDARSSAAAQSSSDAPAAFWIPRRNVFWGHALRGGGWWPDRQLRLLRVDRVHYDPDQAVHELAVVEGATGALAEPMVHLNYASWGEFRTKQMAYARFEAQKRAARGEGVRARNLVLQPLREFRRRFVALGGWRDGLLGAGLCAWMAWVELRTLWMLRAMPGEFTRRASAPPR